MKNKGNIIGHTRNKKPILSNLWPNDPEYKDFTKEDHEDACEIQGNQALIERGKDNIKGFDHHYKRAFDHHGKSETRKYNKK